MQDQVVLLFCKSTNNITNKINSLYNFIHSGHHTKIRSNIRESPSQTSGFPILSKVFNGFGVLFMILFNMFYKNCTYDFFQVIGVLYLPLIGRKLL